MSLNIPLSRSFPQSLNFYPIFFKSHFESMLLPVYKHTICILAVVAEVQGRGHYLREWLVDTVEKGRFVLRWDYYDGDFENLCGSLEF